MGLLDNTTQKEYYQGGDLGSYQFVSLEDVINQFMVIYVGEDKIIPKARRLDVAFHAQRALAEMSFDVFKSIKSQQIDLPASLTMMLPHDYVNYTKVSWVDTSGIKHLLYPTKYTNNPFQVRQTSDGSYDFPTNFELLANFNFDDYDGALVEPWFSSPDYLAGGFASSTTGNNAVLYAEVTEGVGSKKEVVDGVLTFTNTSAYHGGQPNGKAQAVWQKINVEGVDELNLSAHAESTAATTTTWTVSSGNPYAGAPAGYTNAYGNVIGVAGTSYTVDVPSTTVRIGLSTQPGSNDTSLLDTYPTIIPFNPNTGLGPLTTGHIISPNSTTEIFDIDYLEWTAGETGFKHANSIDVSQHDTIFVLITSTAPWQEHAWGEDWDTLSVTTTADSISIESLVFSADKLSAAEGASDVSSTWNSYKSTTPSENASDDYEDDTYWPHQGERYGLEPSHAQVNGSFYIDDLRGKINFSSNISGKTVILDYISDSLGTDGEMQVPKLAEDAIYKHMLCDVVSARANIGRGQLAYYKKQKFAAVRKAKLRLSNIKLEEITQVLRGKSKQIKH